MSCGFGRRYRCDMNLPHRLDQPPLGRLSRTGLLFLGSVALSSHGLPALLAQSHPTPATSQSTGSEQPNRRAGNNYRQGATEHQDTRFLTDVESILRRQTVLSEQAVAVRGPAAEFARELLREQPKLAEELSALAIERKVKLAATAAGERPLQTGFDPRAPDFVQKYVTQLEQDQTRAVQLFRTAAESSNDDEIRAFARRHLALHEQRLERLRGLKQGAGPAKK
jgi:hypothetical protein